MNKKICSPTNKHSKPGVKTIIILCSELIFFLRTPPNSHSPNFTFVFSSYFTCIKMYFNYKSARNTFSCKTSKLPFVVLTEHFSKA